MYKQPLQLASYSCLRVLRSSASFLKNPLLLNSQIPNLHAGEWLCIAQVLMEGSIILPVEEAIWRVTFFFLGILIVLTGS